MGGTRRPKIAINNYWSRFGDGSKSDREVVEKRRERRREFGRFCIKALNNKLK